MPTETEIATPSSEGVAGQTPASQVTDSSPQGDSQQQEFDSAQVGSGDSIATTTQEDTRVKASEYVLGRKIAKKLENRLAGLEQTNQQLVDFIQQLQNKSVTSDSSASKVDLNSKYWENPTEVLNETINRILEERIPKTIEEKLTLEKRKREQEMAVDLIFSNETVKKDPEGLERIKEILVENGLDKFSQVASPTQAAKIALALYIAEKNGSRGKPSNPNLKSQMSATAGGGGSMSTGKPLTRDQIKIEAAKMNEQIIANPELRFDPKFQERSKFLFEASLK